MHLLFDYYLLNGYILLIFCKLKAKITHLGIFIYTVLFVVHVVDHSELHA